VTNGRHYTEIQESTNPYLTSKLPRKSAKRMYRASCSCGWIGYFMTSKSAAIEDADEHVRLMPESE